MNQYGAGTNVGNVRDNNEDSYVCDEQKELWIVADGMGGLGFGEVASAISTFTVTQLIRQGHGVNQAIEIAHRTIKEYAQTDGLGTNMGTTIVLLYSQRSLYNVFWVGDSRAYLYDDDGLTQITTDHSLVQSLIDQGELTVEEAESDPRKNAVTRALGVQELETVRADSVSNRWKSGQKILLCSDGLTDCVSNADIESIIRDGDADQEIVDNLIEAALEGGGKDNVTVVVVSAPQSLGHADSDTHIPDTLSRHDDTHVPQDDTEEQAEDDSETSQRSGATQLQLDIPNPTPDGTDKQTQSTSIGDTSTDAPLERPHKPWALLAVAATMVLAMLMSYTPEKDAPSLQAAFVTPSEVSHPPPSKDITNVDLPKPGAIIQVGLFSKLEGAESRLETLNQLGLRAHIQKKTTDGGLLFAVLLGPLPADSHKTVLSALKKNDLSYFHWPAHDT